MHAFLHSPNGRRAELLLERMSPINSPNNPRHPKYNKETTEYDFSLLELEEDMDFDDEAVGPACLPKDASNKFVGVTGESKKYCPSFTRT